MKAKNVEPREITVSIIPFINLLNTYLFHMKAKIINYKTGSAKLLKMVSLCAS